MYADLLQKREMRSGDDRFVYYSQVDSTQIKFGVGSVVLLLLMATISFCIMVLLFFCILKRI